MDPPALFQALSDPTRLRILALLTAEKELCVCELTHALELSQPMISRHLSHLRESGLVSDRRAGKWIYYRLHPELPAWASNVLTETHAGIARSSPYRTDRGALRRMSNRPVNHCA
ncbi:MAG TPA: transcriptional regulator [Gammaproteobacteria bacterium]|nr:transcriptional regulator [Gammaproteobacteria bacterium]